MLKTGWSKRDDVRSRGRMVDNTTRFRLSFQALTKKSEWKRYVDEDASARIKEQGLGQPPTVGSMPVAGEVNGLGARVGDLCNLNHQILWPQLTLRPHLLLKFDLQARQCFITEKHSSQISHWFFFPTDPDKSTAICETGLEYYYVSPWPFYQSQLLCFRINLISASAITLNWDVDKGSPWCKQTFHALKSVH